MYGRSRKNPPYRWMTDAKWDSLGKTLTVKKALDLWWNSIRVKVPVGQKIACIYKCYDGEYETSQLEQLLKCSDEEVLQYSIELDNAYDEDSDGYPIVHATLCRPEEGDAEEKKMVTRYYVEIKDLEVDMDPPYILQSSWFDTKAEAVAWAKQIDYLAENYAVRIMSAEGEEDETGYWQYEDIGLEKIVRIGGKII